MTKVNFFRKAHKDDLIPRNEFKVEKEEWVILNKASHDYVTAIRYINKLLKLDPKNRKYISKKQEFLDKKSKVFQPISENEIKDLIVYLNNQGTDCSHEFINVKRWASLNRIDDKRLIQWLNDNGAFCDCEVLYNFDEVWYVKPFVPSIQ